ncbi:MAG TPA: hypothetical protein VF883_06675 [Thermoanaerobaculia bacterium]|jgi:hypothetical protein
MATSPRYYLLAENGTIHRLARSAFYDLILEKVAVPFRELSGQRVRLATIHVRLDGRRPVSVAGATFNYMTFRDDGFFDSEEWDQDSDFTIRTWELPTVDPPPAVLDGRERFDARRRQDGTWTPTDEVRQRLEIAAIGKRRTSQNP